MLDVISYVFSTTSRRTVIRLLNKTGAPSVKGGVVAVHADVNNAVAKVVIDTANPIGVFLHGGVPDGEMASIVVSGIADVYFIGSTTRGHLARVFVTGDAGYVAGQAMSEAYPTSPFSTDKHSSELGHCLESRTGAGLAKVNLHFN